MTGRPVIVAGVAGAAILLVGGSGGWIVPLSRRAFPLNDFLAPAVATASYQRHLYAVPFTSHATLLYYRKDILADAGASPPTTWSRLACPARTVAPRYGLEGYGSQFQAYERLTVNFAEAVQSAGGSILPPGGSAVTVDSPQAKQALEFLVSGLPQGWIPRAALGWNEEASRRAFEAGKLLFLTNWPYVYGDASARVPGNEVAGKFGVTVLPGLHGPGTSTLGGANLAISAYSQHQVIALAFIKFLTSMPVQRQVLLDSALPPVWTSLYSQPSLIRRFPSLPVLKRAILTAVPRPALVDYNQFSLAISSAVYQALAQRQSADAGDCRALDRAQADHPLRLAASAPAPARWHNKQEAATMHMWPASSNLRTVAAIAAGGLVAVGLAACGSSTYSASSQVPLSAKQTIVFASAGLGTEGTATKAAIAGFEKLHPNITVSLLSLSSNATVAEEQEEHYFIAGSSTPDVMFTDVSWPSTFARSGWMANLDSFKPNTSEFFPAQMATGGYNGSVYAIPWFINAEGIYYNTSIIKTPPTTEAQLVSDAQHALSTDKNLKEGLAFEGAEYEGSVTAWQSFGAKIGLSSLSNIDNPANAAALTFMYDAIHTYKISPPAVTGWEEANVQAAWLSGQTPFALNWPYLFQLSQSTANGKPVYPAVYNSTAWIPFPSSTPQSSLGGQDLAINAKSTHKAAAWAFIQYLTSVSAQDARAITAGDPPSVTAAYNATLYSAAPYYKDETAVYKVLTPRPVTPVYPDLSSSVFQPMISSVLSGQESPSAALSSNAATVTQMLATVK